MTTIVINRSETFSMVFTPENQKGVITKTNDAFKMVMDALKEGRAKKTCDTNTTLMYQLEDKPFHVKMGYSRFVDFANDARNHM